MKVFTTFALSIACAAQCFAYSHKPIHAIGDTLINIFDSTNVCFNPGKYANYNETDADGLTFLINGRIVLKKIRIPDYKRDVKLTASVTLSSNGDRWDKTGSLFVIPKETAINLISLAKGEKKYPAIDEARYEKLVGIVSDKDYVPNIELMRFMTPFGVGYYSNMNDSLTRVRKPVYIDRWAKEVAWEEDITNLYPALQGEVYVGVFIDTWTEQGYMVSANLHVEESRIECNRMPKRHVLPLVNTVYYMGQEYPDIFARQDLTVDFDMPKNAKNVKLNYIVTGHGGHSGGDEFTQRRNIVSIDGKPVLDFIPWREDCHTVRRYNPSTGVWLIKRQASYLGENGYSTKDIEEPLGSSDLSRSNWCPGTDVPPRVVSAGDIDAGKHMLTISIPEAAPADGSKLNHWLVSAYLTWED